MTPNTRAKIVPALLLAFPPALACFIPYAVGLPASTGYAVAVATVTTVLALALTGARDEDIARRTFGGAPAYWVPATIWLLGSAAAAVVPLVPGLGWGARWALFACATIAALADFGTRVKNR